jgi:hypothetical protein
VRPALAAPAQWGASRGRCSISVHRTRSCLAVSTKKYAADPARERQGPRCRRHRSLEVPPRQESLENVQTPDATPPLKPGHHAIAVRAIDRARKIDRSPAHARFTILRTPDAFGFTSLYTALAYHWAAAIREAGRPAMSGPCRRLRCAAQLEESTCGLLLGTGRADGRRCDPTCRCTGRRSRSRWSRQGRSR